MEANCQPHKDKMMGYQDAKKELTDEKKDCKDGLHALLFSKDKKSGWVKRPWIQELLMQEDHSKLLEIPVRARIVKVIILIINT